MEPANLNGKKLPVELLRGIRSTQNKNNKQRTAGMHIGNHIRLHHKVRGRYHRNTDITETLSLSTTFKETQLENEIYNIK